MAALPALTVEEIRELVYEYLALPYGARGRFLAERDISPHRFHRWRRTVVAGDIERGLVPRNGVMVSHDESAEISRLATTVKRLQAELAVKDSQLMTKDVELRRAQAAVTALGKAIGLLRPLSADEQPGTNPEMGSSPSGQGPTPPAG